MRLSRVALSWLLDECYTYRADTVCELQTYSTSTYGVYYNTAVQHAQRKERLHLLREKLPQVEYTYSVHLLSMYCYLRS